MGRIVISGLLGVVAGLVMLYATAMAGQYFLSCTADMAGKSFTCGPQEMAAYHWILGGLVLCWLAGIPGHAAFGIAGVEPTWATRVFAIATTVLSFVVLFQGFDIATTLTLTDRSLFAFMAIWLILPPALGLLVSGLAAENEEKDEPEPYTGLETYSAVIHHPR